MRRGLLVHTSETDTPHLHTLLASKFLFGGRWRDLRRPWTCLSAPFLLYRKVAVWEPSILSASNLQGRSRKRPPCPKGSELDKSQASEEDNEETSQTEEMRLGHLLWGATASRSKASTMAPLRRFWKRRAMLIITMLWEANLRIRPDDCLHPFARKFSVRATKKNSWQRN